MKKNIVNWEIRLGTERQLSGETVDTPRILLGATLGRVFLRPEVMKALLVFSRMWMQIQML